MQICHNTRKTNPWVKETVVIGRCLSYIRTGDQSNTYIHWKQFESAIEPSAFSVASARCDERESRESLGKTSV